LLDVVNFYDQRFGIGFTEQQKTDLVNFQMSFEHHKIQITQFIGACLSR